MDSTAGQTFVAQGGEKLRYIERLYCILDQDAVERDMLRPGFYDLADQTLAKFKLFQGFAPDTVFPGPAVRQAYLIWAQTSLNARRAMAAANGVPMTDEPILPGEAFLVVAGDEGGQHTVHLKNPEWH
jgi:hypothetical protein